MQIALASSCLGSMHSVLLVALCVFKPVQCCMFVAQHAFACFNGGLAAF
jgi:hypothetical protein